MERRLSSILGDEGFGKVDPRHSRRMAAIRGKGNRSTERHFRLALVRSRIRGWRMHVRLLPGTPDFLFETERVAVFIDGCFWHGCPQCGHLPQTRSAFWHAKIQRNRERDQQKEIALSAARYQVARFWEHEIAADLPGCIDRLRSRLRAKG